MAIYKKIIFDLFLTKNLFGIANAVGLGQWKSNKQIIRINKIILEWKGAGGKYY